jgi:hypothetical protein
MDPGLTPRESMIGVMVVVASMFTLKKKKKKKKRTKKLNKPQTR